MIVIGVLLVLIAAGAVALVLMAPDAMSNAIELTAIGVTVNASPLALFVGGAVTLALFALGFPMITQGIRRNAKKRKELHELRKERAAGTASTPAATSSTPAAAASGGRSSHPDQPQQGGSKATSSQATDTHTNSDRNTNSSTNSSTNSGSEFGSTSPP